MLEVKYCGQGTSIPAGDVSIDPEQKNTYPYMVADALGFELYNQAKAGSLVTWYSQTPNLDNICSSSS